GSDRQLRCHWARRARPVDRARAVRGAILELPALRCYLARLEGARPRRAPGEAPALAIAGFAAFAGLAAFASFAAFVGFAAFAVFADVAAFAGPPASNAATSSLGA